MPFLTSSLRLILVLLLVSSVDAQESKTKAICEYTLDLSDEEEGQGTAVASITSSGIRIVFSGAKPNTLYTIWTDFRSRATGMVAADYPIPENADVDISRTGPGVARGVAPTMATFHPVYEGMKRDRNAVMTNSKGDAVFNSKLKFNLLGKGESPVVAESFSKQGNSIVGGSWMRMYEEPLDNGPSRQVLDKSNRPVIVGATAQGLTIVGHFIPLTHGHSPGVGGVDHFPGFKGDFPSSCMM